MRRIFQHGLGCIAVIDEATNDVPPEGPEFYTADRIAAQAGNLFGRIGRCPLGHGAASQPKDDEIDDSGKVFVTNGRQGNVGQPYQVCPGFGIAQKIARALLQSGDRRWHGPALDTVASAAELNILGVHLIVGGHIRGAGDMTGQKRQPKAKQSDETLNLHSLATPIRAAAEQV